MSFGSFVFLSQPNGVWPQFPTSVLRALVKRFKSSSSYEISGSIFSRYTDISSRLLKILWYNFIVESLPFPPHLSRPYRRCLLLTTKRCVKIWAATVWIYPHGFILPNTDTNSTAFDFLVIFCSFCVYSLVPGVWHAVYVKYLAWNFICMNNWSADQLHMHRLINR